MDKLTKQSGYSFVEMLVTMAIFSVLSMAGFILFSVGQNLWTITDARVSVQQNIRQTLQRVSTELQQSGKDSAGNLKVTILDGAGNNNTDLLRFSIPICVCGTTAIDTNGDVKSWGAPLIWGQPGCGSNYTVQANGKVAICHVPPGNPNNTQNLDVSVNAVKAHLAHGDWLGNCNVCNPTTFTNKTIEYSMNASNQLIRRVIDTSNGNAQINSVIMATNITNFQASINAGQTIVTLTVQATKAAPNRTVAITVSQDVLLRNEP